jgi:hypothetical protein
MGFRPTLMATSYMPTRDALYLLRVSGEELPESRVSSSHDSSKCLTSPCDDPRQHTRMEHGIAPERVVEVALPLLDLESNV